MKAKDYLLRKKEHVHRNPSFFIKFQDILEQGLPSRDFFFQQKILSAGTPQKDQWTQLRILALNPERAPIQTSSPDKGSFECFEKTWDSRGIPFHSKNPHYLRRFQFGDHKYLS